MQHCCSTALLKAETHIGIQRSARGGVLGWHIPRFNCLCYCTSLQLVHKYPKSNKALCTPHYRCFVWLYIGAKAVMSFASWVTLSVCKKLTRQFEVLQHHAKGFVNSHVAVVALINECMHHRDLHVTAAFTRLWVLPLPKSRTFVLVLLPN